MFSTVSVIQNSIQSTVDREWSCCIGQNTMPNSTLLNINLRTYGFDAVKSMNEWVKRSSNGLFVVQRHSDKPQSVQHVQAKWIGI